MILPVSTQKNDLNSAVVKWRQRMTELLKEKELSNSCTFISLHITATHAVNIYVVNLTDPKVCIYIYIQYILFYFFSLYFCPIKSLALACKLI